MSARITITILFKSEVAKPCFIVTPIDY